MGPRWRLGGLAAIDGRMVIHPVPPPLRPFVSSLWASTGEARHPRGTTVERMLPTGSMHLVIRLDPAPLRILEAGRRQELPFALVGGARTAPYLKEVATPVAAVGAMLRPGAAAAFFGESADALAEKHTPLEALWGRDVERIANRLIDLPEPLARLEAFAAELQVRLPRVRGVHPAVALALEAIGRDVERVEELSNHAGVGPRRFGRLFREDVGLAPKRWLRLRRFQRTLGLASRAEIDWARAAVDLGYADQPHLAREFRAFSGLTLGEYRRRAPWSANHVPEGAAFER